MFRKPSFLWFVLLFQVISWRFLCSCSGPPSSTSSPQQKVPRLAFGDSGRGNSQVSTYEYKQISNYSNTWLICLFSFCSFVCHFFCCSFSLLPTYTISYFWISTNFEFCFFVLSSVYMCRLLLSPPNWMTLMFSPSWIKILLSTLVRMVNGMQANLMDLYLCYNP